MSSHVYAAPPANDNLADAINVTFPYTHTVTETEGVAATLEANEGVCTEDNSWWYKVTAPSAGDLAITSGDTSGFRCDIRLGIYTGTAHPLTEVLCTDDDDGPEDNGEIETIAVTAGIYYIRIATGTSLSGTGAICKTDMTFVPSVIVPPPPSTVTLTVTKAGSGTGTVTGDGSYPVGTAITTLSAIPDADSEFVGWSPATCQTGMTLTADTTCVATFEKKAPVTPPSPSTTPLPPELGLFLQIDGSGQGRVTTDTGMSCHTDDCQMDPKSGELQCNPQACTQVVKTVSEVTLTPHADPDSIFSSWGGSQDCIDGQVFMNSAHLCIAYFRRLYPLTVTLQGPGFVQGLGWDQQPMGIDCGNQCEATYSAGTRVYLQATPATGQAFLGWGGDCEGMQNPYPIDITREMKCEARFGLIEVPPAVATEPQTPPPPVTPSTTAETTLPSTTETTASTPPVTTETTVNTSPVTTDATASTPLVTPETTVSTPSVTEETTTVTSPVTTETPETSASTAPVTVATTANTPLVTGDTTAVVTTETPPPSTATETVPPVITAPETDATTPVSEPATAASVTSPVTTPVVPVPVIPGHLPSVVSQSCATTGGINQMCNYGGRTVTTLDVQGQGIVSNGVLNSTLTNVGWVSNFTITVKGKLTGGVVTGYIKNFGIMLNFEFKGASIIGGTLGGNIVNSSKIGGFFQDVTLLANTKITGGILKGQIKGDKKSPAVLEKVRVKKGSQLSGVKLGKGVVLEKGVVVE